MEVADNLMKLLPALRKIRFVVGFVGLVSLGAFAVLTGLLFPRGQFGSQGGMSNLSDSYVAHADAPPSCGTCGTGCDGSCDSGCDNSSGDGCGDCSGDYE